MLNAKPSSSTSPGFDPRSVPGYTPGGAKPIVWRGMVLNSKVRATRAPRYRCAVQTVTEQWWHGIVCTGDRILCAPLRRPIGVDIRLHWRPDAA